MDRLLTGRRGIAAASLLLALLAAAPAAAQDVGLGDAIRQSRGAAPDSLPPPPPVPWGHTVGEVALGTAFAVGAGYGVGLLAESFCDACDASKPGGDGPGIAVGVPLGAILGVWLVGRTLPPSGSWTDTIMGALAGAAVFAGYATLLEPESDGVRWMGAIAPGAITTMAWNRSRMIKLTTPPPSDPAAGGPQSSLRLTVIDLRF